MANRIGAIDPPEKKGDIPEDAQWLLGQGAGAWFAIQKASQENQYNIQRYAIDGSVDCNRVFTQAPNKTNFTIEKPYSFTHVSHCSKCRIIQDDILFIFTYQEV
jgi:hypothetical protein